MKERSLSREWVAEAQKLLLSLRDIVGASITLDEDGTALSEVNILAEGHRPPKQIVRDVRSALRAEYQVDVDYRKISVAQRRDPDSERRSSEDTGPTILALPAAHVDEEPSAHRLRFQGVTVAIEPGSSQIRVELSLGDREAVGEAAGHGMETPRLVALATLDAVGKFLDPSNSLALKDIQVVNLGGEETVLVAVNLVKDRNEKSLTGSCPARPSLQQGVAYATLCALNRVLGRLRYREPVEYQIRPTSTY